MQERQTLPSGGVVRHPESLIEQQMVLFGLLPPPVMSFTAELNVPFQSGDDEYDVMSSDDEQEQVVGAGHVSATSSSTTSN